MTIEIITQGKLPEPTKYMGTCKQCKCRIIASHEDGKFDPNAKQSILIITCPTKNCLSDIHCRPFKSPDEIAPFRMTTDNEINKAYKPPKD
jgi:hypothetical protein